MKNHNLVAFYLTRESAEAAREELLKAGFDRNDTKVFANSGGETGGGFWDSVKEALGLVDEEDKALYAEAARRGASAVAVSLEDDDSPPAQRAIQILQRYQPIDLEQHAAQWRQEGWTGYQQTTKAQTQRAALSRASTQTRGRAENLREGEAAIPVVEEELRIGKRRIEGGGVRIHSRVIEKPVQEQVQLREEHVKVERRPVNRPATDADKAFQERAIEATETREEAVVDKRARVVEEVHLNKEAKQRTETVRDTVRRTDVDVEQVRGQHGRSDEFVDVFATELASDQRFRGRDWRTIEPEARRTFEQRYPDNKWDQFKDTIRSRWDRARSKT